MQNSNTSSSPADPTFAGEQPVGEGNMGEAQTVSITSDPRLRIFSLVINILVVSELFIAMYFAAQDQDRLTPIFFKVFFSLLIPTLVAAFVGRRLLARKGGR